MEKDRPGNRIESAAAATVNNEEQAKQDPPEYQPRTLRPNSSNSIRRREILPAYPFASNDLRPALLLLANVPNVNREHLECQSFGGGHGIGAFEFRRSRFVDPLKSFMVDLYEDCFVEASRRWNIDYSIIDYNLSRLRKCMKIYSKQTGQSAILLLDELPMALEFYLQMDVDLFFMKTCHFRDAQPRLFGTNKDEPEGIFCQAKPAARYGMTPCRQERCFLCRPRPGQSGKLLTVVRFSPNEYHRFVNKYVTVLNCPANCDTSNIIYALTCPCGQCDYIGSTSMTFYKRMSQHRHEGNRIVREFLMGSGNVAHILQQQKQTAKELANKDDMMLYQHSSTCPSALDRFLDKNPDYWCFVPMPRRDAITEDNIAPSAAIVPSTTAASTWAIPLAQAPPVSTKPMFFEAVMDSMTRTKEEAVGLAKAVPDPPNGYRFSKRQIQEQIEFFQKKQDCRAFPQDFADLYNYSIIAVLPEDCSDQLRRFIEALFVTHTESQLNTMGRLTESAPWTARASSSLGAWCANLGRPTTHSENCG